MSNNFALLAIAIELRLNKHLILRIYFNPYDGSFLLSIRLARIQFVSQSDNDNILVRPRQQLRELLAQTGGLFVSLLQYAACSLNEKSS